MGLLKNRSTKGKPPASESSSATSNEKEDAGSVSTAVTTTTTNNSTTTTTTITNHEEAPLAGAVAVADRNRKVIYINILVLDPSGAVQHKLDEKAGHLPKPIQSAVSHVAKRVVTPDKVALKMSQTMPTQIQDKLTRQGLSAAVNLAFLEGPYLVVELQIQAVDLQKLIQQAQKKGADGKAEAAGAEASAASSPEKSSSSNQFKHVMFSIAQTVGSVCLGLLESFFYLLGVDPQALLEKTYLPTVLQRQMESSMDHMLGDELAEQGLEAIAAVLPEHQQARFFYDKIRLVRAATKGGGGALGGSVAASNPAKDSSASAATEAATSAGPPPLVRRFRQVRADRKEKGKPVLF